MSGGPSPDTILAFDYGRRRIGVAVGNRLTQTATPAGVLDRHGDIPWRSIDRLVEDWRPGQLVVGLPGVAGRDSVDGEIHEFVQELQDRYKLAVATVDEALTSSAARTELTAARRRGERTRRLDKGDIDKAAACLIAEQWMRDPG